MKRQTESGRTLTIGINHNRSTALERSAEITGCGLNRCYVEKKKKKKKLALGSAVVKKTYKLFGPREGLLIQLCIKNSKYINQDPTTLNWNKMSTHQQDPYRNAGATDIQQLNPNGPDQIQSIKPQPIVLNILGWSLHYVWGTTGRCAIKEGSWYPWLS